MSFEVATLAVLSLAIIFTVIYFMSDKRWQGGIIAIGAWAISAMVTMGENIDAWPQATFFAGMAMLLVILLMMDYAGARQVDFWEMNKR